MGKISNIEDGFTLPERRKACRVTDVLISTKEYRRLKELEKADHGVRQAYADLDKIQEETAEGCERLIVERGRGPKAAKVSALREYDAQEGFNERLRQIGLSIANRIIADFKEGCNLDDFLNGDFPSDAHPLEVQEIITSSIGWDDKECAPEDENLEDMRENFLYELKGFVEANVRSGMLRLVKVIINGESIWDNWDIKMNLRKGSGGSPRTVDAEVFFDEREE